MNFELLLSRITTVHEALAAQATRAVNISLTLRNWLIGWYIKEYEQRGEDRAEYGKRLFETLSLRLKNDGVITYHPRELRRCCLFFEVYPGIWGTLTPELRKHLPEKELPAIGEPVANLGTPSPKSGLAPELLLKSLSYSHFAELIEIDDPLKRAFYELECVRGVWSVRELKRQIASLYFERCALSKDKERLTEITQGGAEADSPRLTVRDPYIFEFLGLRPQEVVDESNLESELLDKLCDFLLEMGRGFCFEARQKRLLIGDEHFFVDLVLYHRILKCHVIVELKVGPFTHESLGQLNTYINWFRANEMTPGDNPPVGILLCTGKNHILVEYALAGLDNQLFVSRYRLQLPAKEEIERFVDEQRRRLEGQDA